MTPKSTDLGLKKRCQEKKKGAYTFTHHREVILAPKLFLDLKFIIAR